MALLQALTLGHPHVYPGSVAFVGFLARLNEKVLVLIFWDVTLVPDSSGIWFPWGRFRCVSRHLL